MKKFLPLLLICLLMLGLASCSSNESSNSLANQDTQEQTQTQEESVEEIQQEEVIVEEEIKEETNNGIDSEVLKTYKYWVVFFDHDGNELQREAIKWGTIPTYWSDIPYYEDGTHWYKFTGWKDRWGRDVKEFKPITGNTRFYAQYEIGGEVSHYHSEPTPEPKPIPTPEPIPEPIPDPEYQQVTCLTTTMQGTQSYIRSGVYASDNMKFIFKAELTANYSSNVFGYWKSVSPITDGLSFASYTNGLDMYFGNIEGVYVSPSVFGAPHEYEYQIKQDDSYAIMDGTEVYRRPTPYTVTVDTTKEIGIFTCIYADNNPMNSQPLSLYYLKIYKDGSLVRDYIPVKTIKEIDKLKNVKDPTTNIPIDTLCLYDKLNDKYYINWGTVDFVDIPLY